MSQPQPIPHKRTAKPPASPAPTEAEAAGFDLKRAITILQATHLLRGRGGKIPHVESVRRWCIRGSSVRGTKVIMRSVLYGDERLTMPEWVEEFAKARAWFGTRYREQRKPTRRPMRQREREIRAAEAKADKYFGPKPKPEKAERTTER